MRIDGAAHIGEVDLDAWVRLACDVGISERFARRTTRAVIDRTQAALADACPSDPPEIVQAIASRIGALA